MKLSFTNRPTFPVIAMKLRELVMIMFSILSLPVAVCAQTSDADDVKLMFDETLRNGKSYEWLRYLTTQIGPRLSGSAGAAEAVNWAKTELQNIADTVWLQPVMVPHWIRGSAEDAYIKG